MNQENKTTQSPINQELIVYSYRVTANNDDKNTYTIEIKTSAHTIIYPKALVSFGANQAIAFPVNIQVLDNNGNALFNYGLTANQDEQNQAPQEEVDRVE